MTTTKATRAAALERRPPPVKYTAVDDLAMALRAQLEETTRLRFPSTRYQQDPVLFCHEILGVRPWSRQREILEAVRDHPRVAVKSGHKVSKSHTAAALALWFYCSFEDARVVMSSTTSRQVDQILWRELSMMKARGGHCLECTEVPCPHSTLIDGEIGKLARTGLKSQFREVVGFTAKEAEAVAGISGKNILYIVDEASGVPDEIFEAIEGNRAGGARIVMFSNPTRTTGRFHEAFHDKKEFWHCVTISSREAAALPTKIPGLATQDWINEMEREWGAKSAFFIVRVEGEFPTREDGKAFSLHAIQVAEERWADTLASGRLFIGLDPAGEQGTGDQTVFSARRGHKQIAMVSFRGLSSEAHLVHLLSFAAEHCNPREKYVVVLDREGSIGARLYGHLRAYLDTNRGVFDLVAVRASDRAVRTPVVYDRMRDELVANLEQWLRDGGAILQDTQLAREMHEFEWKQHVNGRLKITPKDEIKKRLGRSPDKFDALALSAWEPLSLHDEDLPDPQKRAVRDPVYDDVEDSGIDPYAAGDVFRR